MPWKRICPESAVSRPAIILSRVDFPQPEGPMMHMNSFEFTSKLTSSIAFTSEPFRKILTMSFMLRIGVALN